VILHNLDAKGREISFGVALEGEGGRILINLLSDDHSEAQENGKHKLVIEGYGYRWYRAGGLDYLLRRTEA
jgi:maltose alpha-D-glucosyltransferase / alpha-amylase